MADCRVTCITKPHPHSAHEHITHIGGPDGGQGKPWKITREEAVRLIDSKIHTFFVLDPQTKKRGVVGVVRPADGRPPFLRTHADGTWNDNLLALMQCV
ncbi:MAG: DUF3892 domain-containing protein [Holophaga sp.]|nr:DUF3892 domain-containing protein [Holophaga sp.]